MFVDPALEFADPHLLGKLGGELDTELGLVSGAFEEEDQRLRHAKRDLLSEVLLDERQRHVDAGGRAG